MISIHLTTYCMRQADSEILNRKIKLNKEKKLNLGFKHDLLPTKLFTDNSLSGLCIPKGQEIQWR